MTTADQNKQELIDWLFAYAKKHQIGYLKPNDALIVFFSNVNSLTVSVI